MTQENAIKTIESICEVLIEQGILGMWEGLKKLPQRGRVTPMYARRGI